MWSRAACAKAVIACGSRRSSTMFRPEATSGAERYDRDLADVFAVQDEITESIVAAIEPQLYAAENFRARRKPPGSLDAWDLVMRALSHYWRVTRQDNMVAQALLEKAITIDPNYGQALGVLATIPSAPIGAGRICQRWRRSPSARRYRRFEPMAKAARRFRRWASCADRRRGHGWKARCRQGWTLRVTQGRSPISRPPGSQKIYQ